VPELPEVETLRRDLTQTLIGRRIESVELRLPKLFRPADGLDLSLLEGRTVVGLRRRAKIMIWDLDGPVTLLVHLKLTGQIRHLAADGTELLHGGHPVPSYSTVLPHKATHVIFHLDDGSTLYLTDIRQFARLWLLPADLVDAFLAELKLGPEPLLEEFTRDYLAKVLKRRSVPIKTVLLDQSVISGIGNIYADESLWDAKIHPLQPANTLTPREVNRLHASIRSVLDYALREGVAFVPMGKAISDRDFPYAHGREGEPCRRCGKIIQKAWVGGRGTYWCPKCQRLKPASA
jgi:formamidopyrimidine-DNA glycosylase